MGVHITLPDFLAGVLATCQVRAQQLHSFCFFPEQKLNRLRAG